MIKTRKEENSVNEKKEKKYISERFIFFKKIKNEENPDELTETSSIEAQNDVSNEEVLPEEKEVEEKEMIFDKDDFLDDASSSTDEDREVSEKIISPSEVLVSQWEKKRKNEKSKRKKIQITVLLLLFFIVVLNAGIIFIYNLRGKSFDIIDHPYNVVAEFTNPVISGAHQRSETFASDLCVLRKNVDLESALLEPGQKGILFNLGTKEILYAQGAFDRVYPASITKIMTAMLAFKYGNMNASITITYDDLNLEEGSQVCGFWAGDTFTLEQLLNCLLVYSGNDAAAAIANHIGGSTENFVAMMNQYAKELGCTGTHFTNPHGLQDENHYTTCYDIYLMLKEALQYPEFISITQQAEYTLDYLRVDGNYATLHLEATDHYLTGEATAPKGITVLGGKTGTTSLAGNCLALLTQDAYGIPYCSIVMKADKKELLYEQMNSLLQNINK